MWWYSIITIFFLVVILLLSLIQPGYDCHATINEKYISVNQTPWNCLDPVIGIIVNNNDNDDNWNTYINDSYHNSSIIYTNDTIKLSLLNKKKFNWITMTGNVILNPLQENNSSVSIVLKCSNFINFKCRNNYS